MLSLGQFDVLYSIWKEKGISLTQRELAAQTGISLGKVNGIMNDLSQARLIDSDNRITMDGVKALEPYKVENAVIMAAGMSSRFAPLSYERPKALLEVRGEILIEREIRQLHEAGITDITMVVGYMKEKLFYLADKYNIRIVVNEDYYRYNNPSSLILVTEKLGNTYICSSDNYFTKNPFEPYVYRAYYSAVYSAGATQEYCLDCDSKGKITGVTIGGEASWYMLGHVYFDREFSRRFARILKDEYEQPVTREQLWENLYIRHIDELAMYIRKYDFDDIKEFDSLDELRSFDGKYLTNADSKIFENICKVLKVQESDITDIYPIKAGLTNSSFGFTCNGVKYVYRHPGAGTEKYIDRNSEASSMVIANRLGLDKTYIYMDPGEGWKISYYIDNATTLDYHNQSQVATAMKMLRSLHGCGEDTGHSFDIWHEIAKFEELLLHCNRSDFSDMTELHNAIETLRRYADNDGFEKCLCHCDSYDPNFLVDASGAISLIDWEYSGMGDPAGDLGTFIACSDYTIEEADAVIDLYFGRKATDRELRHYMAYVAAAAYYWFVWAIYQESIGKNVGKYLYIWYRYTKLYSKRALDLYAKEAVKTVLQKALFVSAADCDAALTERLGGMTNRTYQVTLPQGRCYVVRIPGEGTKELICRSDEKVSTELAGRLGIDAPLLYFDGEGCKVSEYIDGAVTMTAERLREEKNIVSVAEIFRKLHGCGVDTGVAFEIFEMAAGYEKIIAGNHGKLYRDYADMKHKIMEIKERVDGSRGIVRVPCHNDALCENWVLGNDGMRLIDWEYAGMNDGMWDLADVSIEAAYTERNDTLLLETYFGRRATDNERLCFEANKIYIDYLWTLWGLTRVPYAGQEMQEYADKRYQRLKKNIEQFHY